MVLNLLQIITLFTIFLLLLLAMVFFFYPVGRRTSNYLLSSFLFSNFILLIHFFAFITFPNYTNNYPILNQIGKYSYFLLAPFLFLYIISLCNNQFRFSSKNVVHFLPYLILTLTSIVIVLSLELHEFSISNYWQYFDKNYKILLDIQMAIYILFSFRELKNYRLELQERYSNIADIDLMWVNLVLYFLLFMWLTDMSHRFLNKFHLIGSKTGYYLVIQSISTDLVLCICLIYKGMRQTKIPSGISPEPKRSIAKLDVATFEDNKILLSQIMETEKLYLMPELNLDELAKMVNVPSKLLSQTINNGFNINFNTYINKYRIMEAKRIIESDANDRKTMFEVLLDSGFNSKSVFNEAFKKHTGITPKEYRKKIKS